MRQDIEESHIIKEKVNKKEDTIRVASMKRDNMLQEKKIKIENQFSRKISQLVDLKWFKRDPRRRRNQHCHSMKEEDQDLLKEAQEDQVEEATEGAAEVNSNKNENERKLALGKVPFFMNKYAIDNYKDYNQYIYC